MVVVSLKEMKISQGMVLRSDRNTSVCVVCVVCVCVSMCDRRFFLFINSLFGQILERGVMLFTCGNWFSQMAVFLITHTHRHSHSHTYTQ